MKYAASIIVVLVLIKLYQIGSAPVQLQDQLNIVEQAEQTIDPITYIVTEESPREYFAVQLLDRLGNNQPSPEIVAFVVEWTIAEDGTNGALERNNPLNTTQSGNNITTVINNDGVKGYATFEDGLNMTVETIDNGLYEELLAGLQTNDPQRAFDGLINSPWAGDHYGDGERWPNVDIIEVQDIQTSVIAVGKKQPPTDYMEVGASFYSTWQGFGSNPWGSQYNGMHLGTDYTGKQGDNVYMPFDCSFSSTGFYDDNSRYGHYLVCYLTDGTLFYSGHLEDVIQPQPGEIIPAGTIIGHMSYLNHTHIKLEPPGSPSPCEGSGTCIDFEEYYATH